MRVYIDSSGLLSRMEKESTSKRRMLFCPFSGQAQLTCGLWCPHVDWDSTESRILISCSGEIIPHEVVQ